MIKLLVFVYCLIVVQGATNTEEEGAPENRVYRGRQVSGRDPYEGSYKPYSFSYVADADLGRSTREETADGTGRVVGSYTIQDEDGRRRVVEYVADIDGFRANVETNEPGTASQNPADVVLHSTAENLPGVPNVVRTPPRQPSVPSVPRVPPPTFAPPPRRPAYRPRPPRREDGIPVETPEPSVRMIHRGEEFQTRHSLPYYHYPHYVGYWPY